MSTTTRLLFLLSGVGVVGAIGCAGPSSGGDGISDLSHSKVDLRRPADLSQITTDDAAVTDDAGVTDDAATDDAATDDAGIEDMAMTIVDLAGADLRLGPIDMRKPKDLSVVDLRAVVDLAGADLAPLPDMRVTFDLAGVDLIVGCHPIVNELQTGSATAAGGDFVEIYNPCPSSIDLANWKLVYRSAGNNSGGSDSTLATIANGSIKAGGYLFYCGSGFINANCAAIYNSGLAAKGGAVGLRDDLGRLVDSVSYDVLTTPNDFTRGMPAPNPPTVAAPGNSIPRLPDGTDTGNNQADFKVSTKPTPGAANQ